MWIAIRGRWGWSPATPDLVLPGKGFVYFETGNLEPRVFCPGVLGGCVPGGSVPGGTSVELVGGVIGGVLPSWL